MQDLIVAIGGADVGSTPAMPFVGRKFDGKQSTAAARLLLGLALLRCGFDISDRRMPVSDPQEMIYQSNRVGADCIVVMSASAFGSRKSFNDVSGGAVMYAADRHGDKSRVLAEDICAKLGGVIDCTVKKCEQAYYGAACPAVVIDIGHLTNFDEAKIMRDPDHLRNICEYAAMGISEYFGMPYIVPSPAAYDGCRADIGMRGKKVKLLQSALSLAGYAVDIDGVYGKSTRLAAKEYAINNYFDGEGIPDYNDLFFITPKTHKIGSRHSDIRYIQQKLTSKLYSSPEHGTLDDKTVAALNEYLTDTDNTAAISPDGVTKQAMQILSEIGGGKPRLF